MATLPLSETVGYWEGIDKSLLDYPQTASISRHDFFAGMALCGMLTRGIYDMTSVERAWKIADGMVKRG